MEHHNLQRRRSYGIPQREDSEQLPQEFIPTYSTQNIQALNPSPHYLYQGHPTSEQAVNPWIPRAQQLPQQTTPIFSSQNIRPLNPSPHHQLQVQPSTVQAVNPGLDPAITVWQYHSSAELPTPNYETLHQSQPQIHQVQSRSPAGHDPAPMFQHEQYIHASTRARPVSENLSQNIQLTYPSQQFRALARDRFRTEPHQYHPPQMPTPEVQPSLLQGVDMTSHAQDHLTQPFSQGGSYIIAGHSIQQLYLPSQHQLQHGQPLAQQETGRLHYGNIGTSSQYLHQGSGVMAQNIQQSEQQILRQPPAHQETDSVKQRKTFKSPEQQLEQHQKSQIPFQDVQQPVTYQQSESPLQRGTKRRKHQHCPERIISQPNLSESDQTSMRNFSETFGKLPQSEHSSHHEGVASSSAGSKVPPIDVTRHGVSMSPLYQKLSNNQTVIEQEAQDKFLKSQGLYRYHIIPDRNSLYRAIAESFYGDQSRHDDLRQRAVKYARENLFQSQHASEGDAELYAALDRSTKENILSHLLGVPIHVLMGGWDSKTEPKFHTHSPGNTDTERPICISWLTIGHYDAVVSNTNHNEVYIKWLEQQISILLQHGKVKEASTHVQSYHISLQGEQGTSDIKHTCKEQSKQQRHDEFIELLHRIAGDLGKDELESRKFLCRNTKSMGIRKREVENINEARDLFEKLLDRKLITADDSTLLVKLLKHATRQDLVELVSPTKPCDITENIQWLQKYLQEKYRRHYEDFKPIPWNPDVSHSLTEIYTRLKVIKTNKACRLKEGLLIENEVEIFQKTGTGLPCRRIAIEGAPAMGKSTFCRKLAYDWACGKLPQFQLLFSLEMRHVSDKKRLGEIIFHQLLPEDSQITKEVLYNYIQQNQNLVLCLFDGLDEMTYSSREKSDIPAIISEKLLTWCTVVTTTRPLMLHSSLGNCHVHFRIEGFTIRDAINFINKYFALVGNQREAEKLISELKLENVKPPPPLPYAYEGHESDLGDYYDTQSQSDASYDYDDDKSLQSVDDTTDSHIRCDLLCNPLHLTFVCLLWEERKIIPTSNMTDIYTDILDCVLKRYCCKNDKTVVNWKVPQDVIDEVNRLAHCAYDACLKDNMMVDEDDLSETILNLGLLVKDSGISRVKVQCFCFFYHKTWLEYFTALHICNNVHDIVNSIEGKVLNQKQVCLFAAGKLKKKAGPLLEQLVKKMQCIYNEMDYDITVEFKVICECLHEAGIDIDYLAPEMPNHLILDEYNDDKKCMYHCTLQHNDKNITFGSLNYYEEFVFEQLSNMLCQTKGSATNIKHLHIKYGSDDRILQFTRQVIGVRLKTFEIHKVSIECMQLLAETLRKGWQLNTLALSLPTIDTKVKEKAKQTVTDLFKSVNCNKYLEIFSWNVSDLLRYTDESDIQDYNLCPLNELIEDGPNYVNVIFGHISGNTVEVLSDSLFQFTTKCKNTKKITVRSSKLIFTKLQQALKSASPVLASYGFSCHALEDPDTTQDVIEALNMNSNISDFAFSLNPYLGHNLGVSNALRVIAEVKHVKSLTLIFYEPCDFESLITEINFQGMLKHLTLVQPILSRAFDDSLCDDDLISTLYLIPALSILLTKGKTATLHSLTITILSEEKELVDKVMSDSEVSSQAESKSILVDQFVTHTTPYLGTYIFAGILHGVNITIDFMNSHDK